jgi:hypothetical protein
MAHGRLKMFWLYLIGNCKSPMVLYGPALHLSHGLFTVVQGHYQCHLICDLSHGQPLFAHGLGGMSIISVPRAYSKAPWDIENVLTIPWATVHHPLSCIVLHVDPPMGVLPKVQGTREMPSTLSHGPLYITHWPGSSHMMTLPWRPYRGPDSCPWATDISPWYCFNAHYICPMGFF